MAKQTSLVSNGSVYFPQDTQCMADMESPKLRPCYSNVQEREALGRFQDGRESDCGS